MEHCLLQRQMIVKFVAKAFEYFYNAVQEIPKNNI